MISPPAAASAPAAGPAAHPPLRLMIVDDSPIARAVLSRMVSAQPDMEVAALASNVEEAL